MAKVPFSKLQVCVNNSVTHRSFANKVGEEIAYEVRNYLPFKEKLELVSNIINQSIDDNGFYNPMRVDLYMALEIVYAYTNLSFTDKMKEDPFKLYDMLISSGVYADVVDAVGFDEVSAIENSVYDTIENIYQYRNSVMGILENVKNDYDSLNLDANALTDKLLNPENLSVLKELAPLAQ